MRLYYLQLDKNTARLFRTDTPPPGAIAMERAPQDDERVSCANGEITFIKTPVPHKKPSIETRIISLEEAVKEFKRCELGFLLIT